REPKSIQDNNRLAQNSILWITQIDRGATPRTPGPSLPKHWFADVRLRSALASRIRRSNAERQILSSREMLPQRVPIHISIRRIPIVENDPHHRDAIQQ